MSRKQRRYRNAVLTFGILNLVLACVGLAVFLFFHYWPLIIEYHGRKSWGYLGLLFWSNILALYGIFCCLIYFVAGLGLLCRLKIGYYAHLLGGVFASFSCIGVGYTVVVLLYAFNEEFTENFFAESQ
jgi:hypothetical protein